MDFSMDFNCISKTAAKVLLGVSIFIAISSVVLLASFQKVNEAALKKDIVLEEGNFITKIWEDLPLPVYQKLYFFNITNSVPFVSGLEPLKVVEVGPYTYESTLVKDDVQWNSNTTVTYREKKTYKFMPEMSGGTEEDIIYSLNGPMIIVANLLDDRQTFQVSCVLNDENVIVKKSIRELAYEGYDDYIIKNAKKFYVDIPYKNGTFSWMYGKNGSSDGLFTVFTGADDAGKTDLISNWNGKDSLNFWNDSYCNMLNGTNAELGPQVKSDQDNYSLFQSVFCRSVTFSYVKDTEQYGIASKRFQPTYDVFGNSTVNPDNQCFEVKKERPSGVLDISPCHFGSPLLLSFPHFYLADASYLTSVEGLNASEEKHGSYIDVNSVTGLSTNFVLRLQMNVEIHKLDSFFFFDNIKGVFPIYWTELSFKIDEDLARHIRHRIKDPEIIAYSVLGFSLLVSVLGGIFSILVLRFESEPSGYRSV